MNLISTRIRNHNYRALRQLCWSLALYSFFTPLVATALDTVDPAFYPTTTNPLIHTQLQVIEKESMALACNPYHRIAAWVAFELTAKDLDAKPRFKRITSKYTTESLLSGPCSVRNDEFKEYTAAGYDRGHLADAESFSGSAISNVEVASTANLSPQEKAFNRGIWAKLEAWQRQQALIESDIMVYVGPVLKDQLPTLAAGISIPEKFYRIIIDKTPPMKVIAFIIDQKDRGSFKNHWVCANQVEKLTGLSFGNQLLGAQKSDLFKNCNFADWQQ